MIKRILLEKLKQFATSYPVITLTGPRQAGKTTLCKQAFPNHIYVNLEDPMLRERVRYDVHAFLKENAHNGIIFDEIQRIPDMTSYIQSYVDQNPVNGKFIITGSQQFEVINTVSQSLAGRTAICKLLPFSIEEIKSYKQPLELNEIIFNGFYPRIYDQKLQPTEALSFYISTYVERDLRELINLKDLSVFQHFLGLCAGNVGQLVNYSRLASDCGVNYKTIQSWLSILEASYILYTLQPHHNNLRKRIIKAPKLYFYDVGLVACLLGINHLSQISKHPLRGAIFENMVISEVLKCRYNNARPANLFFFRDRSDNEVDLILDYGTEVVPIEIKSGSTVHNSFFKGLDYYSKLNPTEDQKTYLIYAGDDSYNHGPHKVLSWKNISSIAI